MTKHEEQPDKPFLYLVGETPYGAIQDVGASEVAGQTLPDRIMLHLLGKGALEGAAAVVAKTFEYDAFGEPLPRSQVAELLGISPAEAGKRYKNTIILLEGDPLLQDPQDPYPAEAVAFAVGGFKGRQRKRATVLAAAGIFPERAQDHADESDLSIDNSANNKREVEDYDRSYVSTDLVRVYLNQIGEVDLLSAEDEVELAKRIEAGIYAEFKLMQTEANGETMSTQLARDMRWIIRDGKQAKNHMLEANLRLAVSFAKRYQGRGMPFLDLIQEANLGLVRAVEKFDYTKGFKFSTYATWWLQQSITRALADQGRTIRLPVHMVEQVNKLGRHRRELANDLGREPIPEELAESLNLTPEKVLDLLEVSRDTISLNMTVGNDTDSKELGDFIADKGAGDIADKVGEDSLPELLAGVLHVLPERSRNIIAMRYGLGTGEPMTLDQIGRHYQVSRERIRQIEREVMNILRKPDNRRLLEGLLD